MASSYNIRENFLEESFILQKHLGMGYRDVRELPLTYRRWYIERLVRHFKSIKGKNKNIGQNKTGSPDIMKTVKTDASKQEDLKKIEKIFKKFS